MTKLDHDAQEHFLWSHATHGLFGIIRILEHYDEHSLPHGPTHDFVRAAMRLRDLAQRIEDKGLVDNSLSFDKPRK